MILDIQLIGEAVRATPRGEPCMVEGAPHENCWLPSENHWKTPSAWMDSECCDGVQEGFTSLGGSLNEVTETRSRPIAGRDADDASLA